MCTVDKRYYVYSRTTNVYSRPTVSVYSRPTNEYSRHTVLCVKQAPCIKCLGSLMYFV